MGARLPLKPGTIVKMPNRGQYIIDNKIGEGGLSLIYAARTKTNGYPVIVKEFFPAEHAERAQKTERSSDGTIIKRKGHVYPEAHFEDRFERCSKAFEREGQLGSSARMKNYQIIAFSDCGDGYAVMPRWSSDSCSFFDLEKTWRSTPPNQIDPVSTDFGRLYFALTAVSSLLTVLSSLHEQNMLHLDISPANVVWAGQSRTSPKNGAAFLTDFGCSILMADGTYPAEYALSYSENYAAPEYRSKDGKLNCTTDIYSVGRLLAYLCRGSRIFDKHTTIKAQIERLQIPARYRRQLLETIERSTAPKMEQRYQSAAEMQQAVTELLGMIPIHPVNDDNTSAFTLYSLKSMLEGCMDTHYSWAHELCDRRHAALDVPESIYLPIANIPDGHFADDETFLKRLLPYEVFSDFWEKIQSEPEPKIAIKKVMTGNYPDGWKKDLITTLTSYGLHHLIRTCERRDLLFSECYYDDNIALLFQIPGEDIRIFKNCYYRCAAADRGKGLALLVTFALLGQGSHGFAEFANSPSTLQRLMY